MKNTKRLLIFIISLFAVFAFSFANVYAEGEGEGGNTDPGQQDPVDPPAPEISISLDKEAEELEVGKTLTITATVENQGDNGLTWSSSDESVATVDNEGKVTAVSEGSATITAKVSDKEATCVINVKAKETTKATLTKVTIKGATVEKIDENTYSVTVTDTDVFDIVDDGDHVKISLSDNKAKYSMTSLDSRNEFKILVGDNTYTFKVKKPEANTFLSSLKITGYSFNQAFDKETYSYTLTVAYDINEIEITASTDDPNASVTGTGYKDLSVGGNQFNIVVTNGNEKKTYKIFVTREEDEDDDTTGTKKKTKRIVTNKNTSNQAEFDIPDVDDPDSTLNMIIITLGSFVLFTAGILGLFFYFKTSPRRLKKEVMKKKNKKEESPIVEIQPSNTSDNGIDDETI